jgi:membrane protein implicated in regulation of membrane protease activity
MAKTVRKRNTKSSKKAFSSPFKIYWEQKNYFFFYLGFILLIVGYYVMSLGKWNSTASLIFSPIILVVAYIIIFPAAILYRNRKKTAEGEKSDTGKS